MYVTLGSFEQKQKAIIGKGKSWPQKISGEHFASLEGINCTEFAEKIISDRARLSEESKKLRRKINATQDKI